MWVCLEVNIAALAAVPAIRTAKRDIFFSSKRNTAVATASGCNEYLRFIYEHLLSRVTGAFNTLIGGDNADKTPVARFSLKLDEP